MVTEKQKNEVEVMDHLIQVYFKLGTQDGKTGGRYMTHISKIKWGQGEHGMFPINQPLTAIPANEVVYMLTLAIQKILSQTGSDGMYHGEINVQPPAPEVPDLDKKEEK